MIKFQKIPSKWQFEGPYYLVWIYRLLVSMFLFFISRIIFYFVNRGLFPGIQAGDWPSILYGGFVFDLAGMLYFNGLFILLSGIPIPYAWRSSRGYQLLLKWVFCLFNGIAVFMNCFDLVYYRFALRRTTASFFKEFSNEQNRTEVFFRGLLGYWYVTVIFVLLILLMIWLYDRLRVRKFADGKRSSVGYYVTASLIFLATIPLAVGGIRGGFRHSTRPITISNAGEYVKRPHEVYLVLNTPFVFVRTFNNKSIKEVHYFSDSELAGIYDPIHLPGDTSKPFVKKNVVIIILESFGKEAVGFYNHDLDHGTYKGYTPFLDSLASVSKVYWNSFASGRKSIDALPSIITSIPSAVEPFVLTPYVSDSIQSLAHLLGKEGYYNSFFHGAPNGSMGFLAFMKMMGIHNYYGKTEYNNDADYDGIWGIWDEPFMQFYQQKLSTFKQPFFSVFFSVSSHHPFKVPPQYEGVFKKGPLPVLRCISYTDMALRKFFAKAEREPWFENTLFVISADHATISYHKEYHNAWGDAAIPILLYAPGDSTMRGIDPGLIQQTDIMPTVLGYLNYPKPFLAFGENVLTRKGTGYAFHYSGGYRWFQGDYLLFFDGEKSTGLFNYKIDRMEKRNLLDTQPALAKEMETQLRAFIQQYNNRIIQNRLTAAAK